jgi:hypothetical protein
MLTSLITALSLLLSFGSIVEASAVDNSQAEAAGIEMANDNERKEVLSIMESSAPENFTPELNDTESKALQDSGAQLVDGLTFDFSEDYVVEKRNEDIFIAYASQDSNDTQVVDRKVISVDESEILIDQQYYLSPNQDQENIDASVVSDGKLIWAGTINQEGAVINSVYQTQRPNYGTAHDACVRSVESLCAVGGGVAGWSACAILGFTTGIGGLSCAAVLGLIGMFGCNATKERVCKDA